MQSQNTISALDLASRAANMQLEIDAGIARLEALSDTLCASTRDRLTRRVNRIPATLRGTPIIIILAPAPATVSSSTSANAPVATSSSPASSTAPATVSTSAPAAIAASAPAPAPVAQPSRPKVAKKTTVSKKAAATTNVPRKTRNVPVSAPTAPLPKPAPKPKTKFSASPMSSRHTATRAQKRSSDDISSDNKENSPVVENKRARTGTTSKPAPKPKTKFSASPMSSRHTATRAQKRSSDEISGDNKENSPVVNKRSRTNAPNKTVTKAATNAGTTRATRAASRQQGAQVLSPKNNNVRQKATKSSARPR